MLLCSTTFLEPFLPSQMILELSLLSLHSNSISPTLENTTLSINLSSPNPTLRSTGSIRRDRIQFYPIKNSCELKCSLSCSLKTTTSNKLASQSRGSIYSKGSVSSVAHQLLVTSRKPFVKWMFDCIKLPLRQYLAYWLLPLWSSFSELSEVLSPKLLSSFVHLFSWQLWRETYMQVKK